MQFHHDRVDENLDPRRRSRNVRRDWATVSRSIGFPRLHELLATALVRLGLVR
jgi:hypothetical protein